MSKVLIIDDDEISNFIQENKMAVNMPNVETLFFLKAQDALDYLESHQDSPPQVIFLDLKMPEMSGFSFLKEYHRRMYHETFPTRIFMLTTSVMASDQKESEKYSSVEGFISKPLETEELQRIGKKLLKDWPKE